MKTIKIILGIITLLVLVFFSTGLIVKETKYTTQVNINKSLEEVFTKFNDPSNIKEWIPEFKSIDTLEEKPGKIGSTYKLVVDNKGEEVVLNEKVLAYVPNEKVTLYYNAGDMLKTDDYTFSHANGVTTIVNKSSCKSNKFLLSCLFPYFKSTFKQQDQGYLNNFKDFVEKQ
ncbi:SRPBCC family protein [Tenacibaculum sp. IB213877]|uniref:SRPBCC family protein n=1 Tax=Tenacibaculum sp. IB213877 TaxID=3097351 RepID=UPI002A5A9FBD|nr:SRPBCC family protein [Tenacibaculum sp. IB213877]MDY0780006.1 SRPBCC family protein [Tenacibaculum sp. IB213877]